PTIVLSSAVSMATAEGRPSAELAMAFAAKAAGAIAPRDGTPAGDKVKVVPPSEGPPSDGPPSDGPPNEGPPNDGPPSDGAVPNAVYAMNSESCRNAAGLQPFVVGTVCVRLTMICTLLPFWSS